MALALPRARHPNRAPFRGVLTLVDSPSDRPPAGARGHRVLLTRAAAERALPSLLGMGLDFTAAYDGHDVRRKVGIITAADIVDASDLAESKSTFGTGIPRFETENIKPKTKNWNWAEQGFSPALSAEKKIWALAPEANSKLKTKNSKLVVHGFLFARDFPDVLRELRLGAHALGMSYEITDARVRDLRDRLWILDDVTFTGAAILRRDKAAYSQTSIELSACNPSQEKPMTPELTQQYLETSSRLALAAESLEQALTRINSDRDALGSKVDRIIAAVEESEAGESRRIAQLESRIAELERANSDLKAHSAENASRASARKTLPPLVTALLAKNGLDSGERVDLPTLDKTLAPLSVEQRVAVKAQMARAGIID